MEADKVTEEPHTTMDAEEHPSSKNPSAKDSQEPPIPETPLEPSISETPLETHTSETLLEPSISETSLTYSVSEIPLETPIPETPLETHFSKVPEKHLTFHTLSVGHVPVSSSDALKEDLFSESSSSEVLWTKRSIQTSESEILQKDSRSGPSTQVHLDRVEKREEEGEDKEGVDATDSTAHTAQPAHLLGKKKGKKGVSRNCSCPVPCSHHCLSPAPGGLGYSLTWPLLLVLGLLTSPRLLSPPFPGYTVHPVVPAKQAELAEVAKAMHREKFGAQVNHLFQWEKNAALNAIQTGLYIGWRCPHYLWDCFRIGDESKCFCGHLLREHQIISDISVPCNVGQCRCLMFCFIPSCPEEVGEFWLKRRATFDPKAWRAQCRCKHSHEDHAATRSHPCRVKGCCCNFFESNFLCAACDRCWEEHETFFETKETRRQGGRPHGTDTVNTWHRPL
ncbi:LOW QUALITY PROTEIN: protein FAM221B [Diceros bicornis minor]|uniref:LOW QUALITY PROTEIN: protein FAM221B n=1 Tax=Diceros bicornis minor TaxID=77932 RepID=UPI0026EE88D3|nr:LOW QUALITY PROTEIN: protein FAM221B [Diceros bicornis minor]